MVQNTPRMEVTSTVRHHPSDTSMSDAKMEFVSILWCTQCNQQSLIKFYKEHFLCINTEKILNHVKYANFISGITLRLLGQAQAVQINAIPRASNFVPKFLVQSKNDEMPHYFAKFLQSIVLTQVFGVCLSVTVCVCVCVQQLSCLQHN